MNIFKCKSFLCGFCDLKTATTIIGTVQLLNSISITLIMTGVVCKYESIVKKFPEHELWPQLIFEIELVSSVCVIVGQIFLLFGNNMQKLMLMSVYFVTRATYDLVFDVVILMAFSYGIVVFAVLLCKKILYIFVRKYNLIGIFLFLQF